MLSAHHSPAYRVMRTPFSEALEQEPSVVMGTTFGIDALLELYFGGKLDGAFAFGGQVAGRVESVAPVADIIHGTIAGFYETVAALGKYG